MVTFTDWLDGLPSPITAANDIDDADSAMVPPPATVMSKVLLSTGASPADVN